MQLVLISQSLLVPLVLSLLLYGFKLRNERRLSTTLLFIWLLSYFWIRGLAPLAPAEALDWVWVWVFSIMFLFGSYITPSLWRRFVYTNVFWLSLVVYVWPVLLYPFSFVTGIEIVAVGAIIMVITFHPQKLSHYNPSFLHSNGHSKPGPTKTLHDHFFPIGQQRGSLQSQKKSKRFFQ